MDWETSMSEKPDLKVIQLFNSEEEVVVNRINSLQYIISVAENDYIPHVLSMLIMHIEENYDGYYIENSTSRLKEGLAWWNASQKSL